MKSLLFIILAVCSLQQEKRITLRFMNENKELIPVFAYWNDYTKIPTKQENISLMRTIQGVSPQIVVTKRFVQLHIISGEDVATMTFEPSGSGVIDIMLPTGDGKEKSKSKSKNQGTKNNPQKVIQ
jgi:hypothetical protein